VPLLLSNLILGLDLPIPGELLSHAEHKPGTHLGHAVSLLSQGMPMKIQYNPFSLSTSLVYMKKCYFDTLGKNPVNAVGIKNLFLL